MSFCGLLKTGTEIWVGIRSCTCNPSTKGVTAEVLQVTGSALDAEREMQSQKTTKDKTKQTITNTQTEKAERRVSHLWYMDGGGGRRGGRHMSC